tara:strand:+ start:2364 stop:2564 length:201 start_codon:yes stop_codon:yes gene_type:complete
MTPKTKTMKTTENRITIDNILFYSKFNNLKNKMEYWKSYYSDGGYYIVFEYKNEKAFNKAIKKIKQ